MCSCSYQNEQELFRVAADTEITLRWIKNYPSESREDMLTGLYWALSQLGAKLPKSEENHLIKWQSDDQFNLNLNYAEFNSEALSTLSKLNSILMDSEEYKKMNGIDIGRYVMLTINSSWHYFKITGQSENILAFQSNYTLEDNLAYVQNSSVAKGERILEFSDAQKYDQIAYLASEGTGKLVDDTFVIDEQETLDVMGNGQIRFGIYNRQGDLKVAGDSSITLAGKPAKCMWCHESGIQQFFDEQPLYEEIMTEIEFLLIRENNHGLINEQRSFINSLVNYENRQDHTMTELLYLSFFEPSIRRLSIEWNIDESQVTEMLKNELTHINHEFDFLGENLYWRNDIDKYTPYQYIRTPSDPREESEYEPNLIF